MFPQRKADKKGSMPTSVTRIAITELLDRVATLEGLYSGREWDAVFIEEAAVTIPYTFMFDSVDHDLRPIKAHKTDAALDLRAAFSKTICPGETMKVATGIRMAIPDGMAGLVLSRSGHAAVGLVVANSPGLIDSGYRGEIGVLLHNNSEEIRNVMKGDRIAQLLIVSLPLVQLFHVSDVAFAETEDTDRGDHGFGSTGLG